MSSDFFILCDALKGVGEYPQHQTMSRDGSYNYRAEDSVYRFASDRFMAISPNLNSILLSSRVKLTDKISSVPIPWYVLILSDRLLELLTHFHLPPYRIYPAPVIHGKKRVSGYNAVHILTPPEYAQQVIFEKSKIWLTRGVGDSEKLEELPITSADELEQACEKVRTALRYPYSVRAEYFFLQPEFLDRMDLFALPSKAFPAKFYISSDLRSAIEKEDCTGMRFVRRQDWEVGYMGGARWSCVLNLL